MQLWSWWWSECNNHGWALWLAVENEWRELFATTPVSLRVFTTFLRGPSKKSQKFAAAAPYTQLEQLKLIHPDFVGFAQKIINACVLRSTQACLPAYSNFTIFTLGVEKRANNTLYLQLHDAHSLMRVVWQHFFCEVWSWRWSSFRRDFDDEKLAALGNDRALIFWHPFSRARRTAPNLLYQDDDVWRKTIIEESKYFQFIFYFSIFLEKKTRCWWSFW